MSQAILAALGPNLRVCDSADFDGTNDYMSRGAGLTGIADSKVGIFSAWFMLSAFAGSQYLLADTDTGVAASYFGVRLDTGANGIAVFAKNAANASICEVHGASVLSTATWYHLLLEWDMTRAPSSPVIGYLNDSAISFSVTTASNDTIDYTRNNCFVGALGNGNVKFDGFMAEYYFAPGQSIDLTSAANRRKFSSYGGLKPLFLGGTGALPTGTAPIIYHSLDDGQAVANFATNKGTGGNFAITGTLATGASSPSD